jgi:hypothetical protein
MMRRALFAAGVGWLAMTTGYLSPAGVLILGFAGILAALFKLRPLLGYAIGLALASMLYHIDPPAPWFAILAGLAAVWFALRIRHYWPGWARPSGAHTPGFAAARKQRRVKSAGKHEPGSPRKPMPYMSEPISQPPPRRGRWSEPGPDGWQSWIEE